MKPIEVITVGIAVVAVFACALLLTYADSGNEHHPPQGCAYVDVNPGKGYDERLACAKGYWP